MIFHPFILVFCLYQDDGRVIMKGCAMEPPLRLERFSPPPAGLEPQSVRQEAIA